MFGEPLRVAIVGSREYSDLERVREYVRSLPAGTIVVSGGARGVDKTAETEARVCGLPEPIIHKPDHKAYPWPAAAMHARNVLIAQTCDLMTAFWDGKSTGTMDAVLCARKLAKPVGVIR